MGGERKALAQQSLAEDLGSTSRERDGADDSLTGSFDAELPLSTGGPLVAECLDNRHPSIVGRVLVRVAPPRGAALERWVPALQGLSIRKGDRVLLQRAENWPEPIVTGVVDGFARRPALSPEVAATIAVLPDEVVRVEASDGTPLVEVRQGEAGAAIRVVEPDVELELPGDLRIKAKRIALSSEGEVEIAAADDVNVKGETINLN